MPDFPWHPAVVHLPLGLSLAQPVFVLAAWLMERRNNQSVRTWRLLFLSQCLVVVGAYLALHSGDWAEPKAIGYVDSNHIYAHASQGRAFLWAAIFSMLVAGAIGLRRFPRVARLLRLGFLTAVLITAWLGVQTGHSGGELVYRYGAASGYANTPVSPEESKEK